MREPTSIEPKYYWKGYQEQLVTDALARLPDGTTPLRQHEVLSELVQKLSELKEFERYDPKTMESIVEKTKYQKVSALQGHTEAVSCLQAFPNGRIVSGSDDHTLRVWTQGADGVWASQVLSGHTKAITCLQALPDGRLVSGGDDDTLRVWTTNADGGWDSETLSGHTSRVSCLQALPDGRIVSGSRDKTLRVWTKDGDGDWRSEILSEHTKAITCLHLLPDRGIVSGGEDATLCVWTQGADGDWRSAALSGHTSKITCVQALPDGRIVSGSADDTLRVWTQTADKKWQSKVLFGHPLAVTCLHALPDGGIVSGGGDVRVWKKSDQGDWNSDILSEHVPFDNIVGVQALADGRIVSVNERDADLREPFWGPQAPSICDLQVWSKCADGKWMSRYFSGHSYSVRCLQALRDGRIVSGGEDKTIRIWDGAPIPRASS